MNLSENKKELLGFLLCALIDTCYESIKMYPGRYDELSKVISIGLEIAEELNIDLCELSFLRF